MSDLAFVSVRTTGLDPERHELLEIGVVRVDPSNLEPVEHRAVRVRSDRAGGRSGGIEVDDRDEEGGGDTVTLACGLRSIAPLLEGALVAGHNVGFDWSFLEAGFRRAELPMPSVDYHRLDTASLAWPLVADGQIASLSLNTIAEHFGLERPRPHRALADARCSLEIARRLVEQMRAGGRVTRLAEDEREICGALLDRLDEGRRQYGPWRVDDGRDYPREAYAEVLDGLHYTAAELVRRRRLETERRRRVYVCHPFASDPAGNIERVRGISQALVAEGVLPVAPHLYLPQLVDEATDRERALSLCLELLATCDEVRVFGDAVTEGMELELREAKRLGVPVRFVREVFA